MLSPHTAQNILTTCGASHNDFHALPAESVERLLACARLYRYRAPRNANGSLARYWHAYLMRRANTPDANA